MPGILKISLFLILLISSISTGLAVSSENFSVSVEEIRPISQIMNPYFDSLVESSGTGIKEQTIISSSWSPDGSRLLISNEFTDLSVIKLEGYKDPLSIDLLTPAKRGNCELRVRCMSEPVADALLTFNDKEIGFTNSSGLLNYSYPDAGRYVINASKTGYRPSNRVLIAEEVSSPSSVKYVVSEPSPDPGKEVASKSEFQIPGFRGITVILLLIFFVRGRNSL